jgi:serine protease Do
MLTHKQYPMLLALVIFVCLLKISGPGLPNPAYAASGEISTVEVVSRYGPSVVAVHMMVEGFLIHPTLEPQDYQGGGSGFVVDDEGRIVTNYHVVAAALQDPEPGATELALLPEATITVSFIEDPDRFFPVRVRGANPDFDLALLEIIDPEDRPRVGPLPLGDSAGIKAGEKAIAIGSPFGLHSSVTTGVVSAIERERPGLIGIDIPFIQTDAAINPGNSGGPLFNARGEVIGINNAILAAGSGPGAFLGVGFAVPVNLLKESMDALVAGGLSGVAAALAELPDRPRLGLSAALSVEDFPPPLRRELNLPAHGIVITDISPGGPADRAGLIGPTGAASIGRLTVPVGGDIIVAANDEKMRRIIDLQQLVLRAKAGDVVTLMVWRNGEMRQVEVTLEVVAVE